eukprot:3866002-Pleurochrysis_carterae.AAC.2
MERLLSDGRLTRLLNSGCEHRMRRTHSAVGTSKGPRRCVLQWLDDALARPGRRSLCACHQRAESRLAAERRARPCARLASAPPQAVLVDLRQRAARAGANAQLRWNRPCGGECLRVTEKRKRREVETARCARQRTGVDNKGRDRTGQAHCSRNLKGAHDGR